MKVILYTCITKGYDSFPPSVLEGNKFDHCVLFTDDHSISSLTWEVRELASPRTVKRADHINRYHKLFAESLFPGADISIYIDGNVDLIGDISSLVKEFADSGALFGCLIHPQRNSVLEETQACRKLGKFKGGDAELVNEQLLKQSKEGFPSGYPLFAATVLFRRHNIGKELNLAMSLWWEQVNHYTCRDQLSLPYVLWKTQLPYKAFNINIFDNTYFCRRSHQEQKSIKSVLRKVAVSGVKSIVRFKDSIINK